MNNQTSNTVICARSELPGDHRLVHAVPAAGTGARHHRTGGRADRGDAGADWRRNPAARPPHRAPRRETAATPAPTDLAGARRERADRHRNARSDRLDRAGRRPDRRSASQAATARRIDPKRRHRHAAQARPATDHAYYALYGWAPGGELGLDDVPGALTEWHARRRRNAHPRQPDHAGLDQRGGHDLPPHHRGRREVHVHRHPVGREQLRRDPAARPLRRDRPPRRTRRPQGLLHPARRRRCARPTSELGEIDYDDVAELEVDPREGAACRDRRSDRERLDRLHRPLLDDGARSPTPASRFTSVAKYAAGADIYQTEMRLPTVEVAAGATSERDHPAVRRRQGMGNDPRLRERTTASSSSSTRSTGGCSSSSPSRCSGCCTASTR